LCQLKGGKDFKQTHRYFLDPNRDRSYQIHLVTDLKEFQLTEKKTLGMGHNRDAQGRPQRQQHYLKKPQILHPILTLVLS